MAMTAPVDVVVLLGSRWSSLERVTTRWQQVVRRWAARPDVGRLTVVDFPVFRPGTATCAPAPSWLPDVDALSLLVPLPRRPRLPIDRWGWRAAATALRRALPTEATPVVVASTPLWCPLLPHLPWRTGFDGYDDWRVLPSVAAVRGRVDAGYRCAARAGSVSAVSVELRDRLQADYGLRSDVVPNGADTARMRAGGPAPEGLPDSEFAVYVGVVEDRVDLDLLARTRTVMPVVVAGPVQPATGEHLRAAGVTCLGQVDPALVPGLLSRASVALVPHLRNPLTASMDPMKLYDYRAAGLPVVATDVAGTTVPGVRVSEPDEWESAVRNAAAAPREHHSVRDWDDVADELFAAHVAEQRLAVARRGA